MTGGITRHSGQRQMEVYQRSIHRHSRAGGNGGNPAALDTCLLGNDDEFFPAPRVTTCMGLQ